MTEYLSRWDRGRHHSTNTLAVCVADWCWLMTNGSAGVPAWASGTFTIGGDLPVHRLGYGAMQLTGPGVWGYPPDEDEAIRVLRRTVDLGVTFIDTADSYGPEVSERLIRRALHPYPDDLVIATKAGFVRTGPGPGGWQTNGRPEYLRRQAETSLRLLSVDQIKLFQLHRIDPLVPLVDQIGTLTDLQMEGKIRYIGLSEVSVTQIRQAERIVAISTVQNLYNLVTRDAEPVLDYCASKGIGFIPYYPLGAGAVTHRTGLLDRLAAAHGATRAQLALAWLLHRSPVMIPIPGTSKIDHLEENLGAAGIKLSRELYEALSSIRIPDRSGD